MNPIIYIGLWSIAFNVPIGTRRERRPEQHAGTMNGDVSPTDEEPIVSDLDQ